MTISSVDIHTSANKPQIGRESAQANSIYVITGQPGCGKSELCAELYKAGFIVLPEVARRLIAHNELRNSLYCESLPLPWTNLDGFQRELIAIQLNREKVAREISDTVFSERGISDSAAYYMASTGFDYNGQNKNSFSLDAIPSDLRDTIFTHKYAGVFILDPLPYKADSQRREDPAHAARIHEQMFVAYRLSGHEPIRVPVLPICERAQFILEKVDLQLLQLYKSVRG